MNLEYLIQICGYATGRSRCMEITRTCAACCFVSLWLFVTPHDEQVSERYVNEFSVGQLTAAVKNDPRSAVPEWVGHHVCDCRNYRRVARVLSAPLLLSVTGRWRRLV